MFDDSQQYVIDSNEYPLMCFAGPGSGKTRTLLGKAYKLAFDKNRKGNILILCFNKAIKEEIEEKLNEQGLTRYGVEVKTLHAAGLKFIMEAFGKGSRLRLNYLTASQNRTFYYGDDQKNIPGLMNTLLKMFGGNPIRTLFENRILSEINVLAANFLLECSAYPPFEMKVKHSRHFHSFTVLVAKLLRLATVTPKPENFVSQYAKFITEDFFSIIDRTRKQKNFIKYFIKLFYTGEFVPYVHNCLLNFASKGDLFGRYANAELDVIPPFVPKIFLYLNDLELENLPYSKYADLFLTPELGSLIQSASLKQLLEWNQLDYDQMISLGAVAMQKIKPNYYAVLVDEAQDLTLHDWYLTYEMAPKYLITDQSKRLLYVGDLMQCWEINEEIATKDGKKKAYEVKVGDEVKSFAHGKEIFTSVTHNHTFKDNTLIRVTTDSGKSISVSKNHLFLANTSNIKIEGVTYFVYLMYRSDLGYRIGITKNSRNRMHFENASRIWVLKPCTSLNEALLHEKLYSLRYQIPVAVFNYRRVGLPQEFLEKLFREFGKDHGGIAKIFEDFSLYFDAPDYTKAKTRSTETFNFLKIGLFRVKKAYGNSPFVVVVETDHELFRTYNITKHFNNYKEARLFAEDLSAQIKQECPSADVFLHESLNINDKLKHFSLVRATSLYPGYKIPVSTAGTLSAETIVKVEKLTGDFQFSSIEVAKTGVVFSDNGILTHNSINRWRYASADRFAEYSKKHAYKQLEFSYRCPDIIVAKANNIKNRSSMVHPEGEFRSAAKDQPGMFSVLPEMIKPEDLEDFLNNQGLRMSDLAILARTNMDLLSWQVWAVIRDIPIAEMYVNKWNIDTPSMRLLLALICLADRSSSTENVGIASFVLNNIKDDPLCAKRFTEQLDKIAPDLEEELILKWFSCLLLKDEEDLTEEEMAEVLMGKGAVTMLRAWYAGDKFSLKSDYVQYLRQKDYQIRKHPSGLTLSTIHRFKGKEKNAVLIFSNAWGRMTEKAMNDGKRRQIEEELALAYVAVSRARKAAFLSGNVHPDLY